MTQRTAIHGLKVDSALKDFIDTQVLPGTGVDAAAFWQGFDAIVHELGPKNAALLAERERLQAELVGLFVEDANLLRSAALPFVREINLASGQWQAFEPAAIERDMRARAARARRLVEGKLIPRDDVDAREAQLAQAQASLTLSQANNQRAAELLAKGAASQRTRDESLSKMRMDEASVALAKARLAKTRITAPYDGVAGLRKVAVGDYVTPGQDLVTLDVIDPIKLEFRVPELYLSQLAMDQMVTFELDALPGRKFEAKVYAIDPQVDVDGRSLAIRARAPNADRLLRPGLFARASLGLARHDNAILIPEEAIMPQGSDHFVYKIDAGKVAMVQVRTGIRRDGAVEILAGLSPTDTVVTAGQLKLHEGAAVNVRSASAQ